MMVIRIAYLVLLTLLSFVASGRELPRLFQQEKPDVRSNSIIQTIDIRRSEFKVVGVNVDLINPNESFSITVGGVSYEVVPEYYRVFSGSLLVWRGHTRDTNEKVVLTFHHEGVFGSLVLAGDHYSIVPLGRTGNHLLVRAAGERLRSRVLSHLNPGTTLAYIRHRQIAQLQMLDSSDYDLRKESLVPSRLSGRSLGRVRDGVVKLNDFAIESLMLPERSKFEVVRESKEGSRVAYYVRQYVNGIPVDSVIDSTAIFFVDRESESIVEVIGTIVSLVDIQGSDSIDVDEGEARHLAIEAVKLDLQTTGLTGLEIEAVQLVYALDEETDTASLKWKVSLSHDQGYVHVYVDSQTRETTLGDFLSHAADICQDKFDSTVASRCDAPQQSTQDVFDSNGMCIPQSGVCGTNEEQVYRDARAAVAEAQADWSNILLGPVYAADPDGTVDIVVNSSNANGVAGSTVVSGAQHVIYTNDSSYLDKSVVVHEAGHLAILNRNPTLYGSGTVGAKSMNEGIADILSVLQTGGWIVGPNLSSVNRDLSVRKTKADYGDQVGDRYNNGQIIGHAIYKLNTEKGIPREELLEIVLKSINQINAFAASDVGFVDEFERALKVVANSEQDVKIEEVFDDLEPPQTAQPPSDPPQIWFGLMTSAGYPTCHLIDFFKAQNTEYSEFARNYYGNFVSLGTSTGTYLEFHNYSGVSYAVWARSCNSYGCSEWASTGYIAVYDPNLLPF